MEKRYVAAEASQVVNTSWALLALMRAGYKDGKVIRRGIEVRTGAKPVSPRSLLSDAAGLRSFFFRVSWRLATGTRRPSAACSTATA